MNFDVSRIQNGIGQYDVLENIIGSLVLLYILFNISIYLGLMNPLPDPAGPYVIIK